MTWSDISVEVPAKDLLESAGAGDDAEAKSKQKPVKAVMNRPVTGYLTDSELEELDSKLDGRVRAALVRKVVLQWMAGQ